MSESSGAPRLPADAARLTLLADCALSSCLSLPSGSPVVETVLRLKSTFAPAAAETSGWTEAERAAPVEPISPVAIMGLVPGTVTVRINPVAARAMPAFCPTPLAPANSVTWRKGLRLRRASRCGSRGRPAAATASDTCSSKAGPVARRRPLAFWVVKGLPLWIACEVSCRIRIREFKDPVRHATIPAQRALRGSFVGVLAAGGLHPETVFQQPVVVPPPLPVGDSCT